MGIRTTDEVFHCCRILPVMQKTSSGNVDEGSAINKSGSQVFSL